MNASSRCFLRESQQLMVSLCTDEAYLHYYIITINNNAKEINLHVRLYSLNIIY